MKNSRNKIIASLVCGIVIGTVGTSYIGNFQANASSSNSQSASIDSNTEQVPSSDGFKQSPEQQSGDVRGKGGKGGHHHAGEGSLEADSSINIQDGDYTDGTYTGVASAYGSNLTVEVIISGGKISNIEVLSHNETPGFYERAFESVPNQIISSQSTDVDTVSGATYTSVGIINAVNNALSSETNILSGTTTQ